MRGLASNHHRHGFLASAEIEVVSMIAVDIIGFTSTSVLTGILLFNIMGVAA